MDDRIRMLASTVHKLFSRGARPNIVNILEKAHVADLAEVLGTLNPEERIDLFQMVQPLERRAEIFSYLSKELQKECVSYVSRGELLQLISLMDNDDAADVLGHLPEEDAKAILAQMMREDSQEVAGLLGYPEDSAGGIMNSEYLALNQNLTVGQAIERIQQEGDEGHVTFYLYLVNDNNQLVGVSSLKQLLLSKRSDLLKQIMFTDVISVTVETDQQKVAEIVARYDFLALPVVGGNNQLMGVITVDDVLDVIRESAEEDLMAMGRAPVDFNAPLLIHFKSRIPWHLVAFVGGGICFWIILMFGKTIAVNPDELGFWSLAAFLPLLITLGSAAGSQSVAVALGAIRSGRTDTEKVKKSLYRELMLSFILAGVFFPLVVAGAWLASGMFSIAIVLAASLAVQLVLSMLIGHGVPLFLSRLGFDPLSASVPVYTAAADITAVLLLLGFFHLLH